MKNLRRGIAASLCFYYFCERKKTMRLSDECWNPIFQFDEIVVTDCLTINSNSIFMKTEEIKDLFQKFESIACDYEEVDVVSVKIS